MPCEPQDAIDQIVVHMYRMGTGDCFVLKFKNGGEVAFKMLIDCGCWRRKFEEIRPFVRELKKDVDGEVDVLVVTHEHLDHVLGFQAGKKILSSGFKAKSIWMGWTERDSDAEVRRWKEEYGEKKRALGLAADRLIERVGADDFGRQYLASRGGAEVLALRQNFASVLKEFKDLHVADDGGACTESLAGMAVVKDDLAEPDRANVRYFEPGDVIENEAGLEGIRIYVLGPPKLYQEVRQEHGEEGESYEHNRDIDEGDLFVQAMSAQNNELLSNAEPFRPEYGVRLGDAYQRGGAYRAMHQLYSQQEWRRIDDDWLFSAGQLALRMNSLTNNLSLVLAIEFIESGKVVLFPGDAEFGSWSSWHRIDWESRFPGLTTEKLLNRVVFYKVAHHLSHNGTARSVGLDMMIHPDLTAMATLDYDVISEGWTSTMPNRLILKDLLEKTKGRLMVMNSKPLFYDLDNQIPLDQKIEAHRQRMTQSERAAFDAAHDDSSEFFTEFVVTV